MISTNEKNVRKLFNSKQDHLNLLIVQDVNLN